MLYTVMGLCMLGYTLLQDSVRLSAHCRRIIYASESYCIYPNVHCCRITYAWLYTVRGLNVIGYTGCPRRKGPNFGRVFLRSYYTDITQNTYIQSSMVTEILAREKCGHLSGLFTVVSVTSY